MTCTCNIRVIPLQNDARLSQCVSFFTQIFSCRCPITAWCTGKGVPKAQLIGCWTVTKSDSVQDRDVPITVIHISGPPVYPVAIGQLDLPRSDGKYFAIDSYPKSSKFVW